ADAARRARFAATPRGDTMRQARHWAMPGGGPALRRSVPAPREGDARDCHRRSPPRGRGRPSARRWRARPGAERAGRAATALAAGTPTAGASSTVLACVALIVLAAR